MTTAAHGTFTAHGRPLGYSSLTPFLAVSPASAALDFYRDVFGAEVLGVVKFGDLVAHAELAFEQGRLQLGEPSEEYGLAPQSTTDAASFSLALYVPDVDAVVALAVAAGAVVREPAVDFVSGDRFASIRDPFGVRWSLMTRVEDLSDEESARRVSEWAATQGG